MSGTSFIQAQAGQGWMERISLWFDSVMSELGILYNTLSVQLSDRLLPLIEQLKPIWQDPLWQAVGLVIAIVAAFFVGSYLIKVGSSVVVVVYQFLLATVKTLWGWISKPVIWLYQKLKGIKGRKKKTRWQGLSMLQVRRAANAVQYLTTKRDWRYATPWMLLIGEYGSGKSRLIDSVRDGIRAQLLPREKELRVPGSGWHFFDHALVIDQDNGSADPEAPRMPPEERRSRFEFLVQQLHWYRPERPVDAVILTVSAGTLLETTEPAALHALGEDLYQQLWQCQKTTGFVLPVYLVVTQCDKVEGFNAFWQAQAREHRKEIIGWSNPYRLDSAFDVRWLDETFEQVVKDLLDAQLEVAAGGEPIDDIDRFMLFKRYFAKLKEPLKSVVSSAFARSSFQEALPLRGVYFTGELDAEVAFVDDLMNKKVFAEKNLAYPLEKRRFSTQKTLRRFQFASVGVAVALLVLMGIDSFRLDGYTLYAKENLQRLLRVKQDCTAEGLDTYRMLAGLNNISDRPLLMSMPLSWFGTQDHKEEQMVADDLMKKELFKGLECRLKVRADELRAQVHDETNHGDYRNLVIELKTFSQALEGFQENRDIFLDLAGPLASTDGIGKKFQLLLKYLYDRPIPKAVDPGADITVGAIQLLDYGVKWDQGDNALVGRDTLLNHLDELSMKLHQAIIDHAQKLPLTTLRDLSQGTPNYPKSLPLPPSELLENINNFQHWVDETEQDWLGATASSSPCGQVYELLSDVAPTLIRVGYNEQKVNEIVDRFSEPKCDRRVRNFLSKLQVTPFGDMFVKDNNNHLQVSPELDLISRQVADLESLGFVTGSFPALSESSEQVVAWRELPLQDALDMLLDYQKFLADHSSEKAPFFAGALHKRLSKVVERLLGAAMIRPSQLPPSPYAADDPTSFYEAELSQSVASFKNADDLLLQIAALLQQLGDNANRLKLTENTRNFVMQQLARLDKLTVYNRLYRPVDQPKWGERDFARTLFNLDTQKQLDTYLSAQRQRISFLAYKYADPLVAYLQNSQLGVADPVAKKWWNTLGDLGQYQRSESPNQVQTLNDYIGVTLAAMDDTNCYGQSAVGTADESWFGVRYEQLQRQVGTHCQSAGESAIEKRYLAIRERFNRELAGRFPFADVGEAGQSEMSVADLKAFLDDYRTRSTGLLSQIDKVNQTKPGSIPQSWRRFIEQMNHAEAVFAALWSDKEQTWQADVNVQFAAKNSLANGADQIIEWTLNSNQQQLNYPNGGNSFHWQLGYPLSLNLRWASGSSFEPMEQPDQWEGAPLQVDQNALTADFHTQGNWGLFEWLARYGSFQSNDLNASDKSERLLSFHVPVILKGAELKPRTQTYVSRSNLLIWINVTDDKGNLQKLPLPGALPALAPGFND